MNGPSLLSEIVAVLSISFVLTCVYWGLDFVGTAVGRQVGSPWPRAFLPAIFAMTLPAFVFVYGEKFQPLLVILLLTHSAFLLTTFRLTVTKGEGSWYKALDGSSFFRLWWIVGCGLVAGINILGFFF